ncbi:peptidoglycan-binding domain-containing protein [Xylanimonas sp. McL0601]|uniref:peptidoglycan-binding domain-containing protein n=1 Tax=Xylanimonas sp. McL0601 TaxID=3414739 RepID=UPI003CE6FF09
MGESTPLPVTARWPAHPAGTGASEGTVTGISAKPGQEVRPGDVLFTVDLRPVVVAQGQVPSFRELAAGSHGEDVAQLQSLLIGLGHLRGKASGRFDSSTTTAVRAWQRALGIDPDGVVHSGDVVYVPAVPARIVLDDTVRVGARVTAGQQVVSIVEATPQFTVTVGSGQQADTVPTTGTTVDIQGPDGKVWHGVVADATTTETGDVTLRLDGAGGGPVCGTDCSALPYTSQDVVLSARVVTTPDVSGPAVPPAALGTAADGTRFVKLLDGTRVTVTVKAADASRAVVTGVDVGTVVRLFADGAPAAGSGPAPGASPTPAAAQ